MQQKGKAGIGEEIGSNIKWASLHFYSDCMYLHTWTEYPLTHISKWQK